MSTHKSFVQELQPVTFITFDNDTTWDHTSGYIVYANTLYDESNNGDQINGILHIDTDAGTLRPAYLMGQTSLIENQQTGIYSIVLAPNRYDTLNKFRFSKSFIEIPYTDRIQLPYSFTYEMMFNIKMSAGEMRNYIWDNNNLVHVPVGGSVGYNYSNLRRTLIKKGNSFSITYCCPYSSSEYFEFVFPNNTGTLMFYNILGGSPVGKNIHLTATHEYILMDDGRYYTQSIVYMDLVVVYSYTSTPTYGSYNGGNTAPIFLCGNQDDYGYNDMNDRWTTPVLIDQVAVFDKALDATTISMLHKKIYSYISMVTHAYPNFYYKMDDLYSSLVIDNYIGDTNYDLNYIGTAQQVVFQQTGVHGIYGGTSTKLQGGGMLYKTYTNGNSYFNPSGDMTIDFFASFEGSDRGILLSIQDDVYPFRGITLFVNSKENGTQAGMLQLSVTDTRYCHSMEFNVRGERIYYNDGVMRHYVLRRTGLWIELWIDGAFVNKVFFESGNLTTRANSIYLFNMSPSTFSVVGKIQHLAFYSRAISDVEIIARANYLTRYKISGRVTIGGVGANIVIRIYSFLNGTMILETESDGDGKYNIDVNFNDYVNFIFLKKNDVTVRPRTIGAILPDAYIDSPYDG